MTETEIQKSYTGTSFAACVLKGVGVLHGAQHEPHKCGCEVTGNGTPAHPLTIKYCQGHQRAVAMREAILKANVLLTEYRQDVDTCEHEAGCNCGLCSAITQLHNGGKINE